MTLHLAHTPGFTGSPLERLDHLRDDAEALFALQVEPSAQLLALDGLVPLLDVGGDRLRWLPLASVPAGVELALLGKIDGAPCFVALDPDTGGSAFSGDIRRMMGLLPATDLATYAAARSLVDWHARHPFCAQCGSPTAIFRAGWARRCAACRSEHFPRTDPVVIMLAEYRGSVLVGRQPRFPAGNYSALAGFVEVGESIEEAVARELFEEAGVRATRVRYIASQPWPFPSSLMIACIAEVDGDAITLDVKELEDAMWVSREDVANAVDNVEGARFRCPPPYAIAHTLLRAWLTGA
jgi:NAD+ diphosphatase